MTEPVHPDALAMLDGQRVTYGPSVTAEVLEAHMLLCDAVLVRTRALRVPSPSWRIVSKHGVGVDNLDLGAMRAAGVTVTNTPGANAAAVAEQTLMLMLALARGLDVQLAGRARAAPGLEGRRLTVVGHGATGARVAALGLAFGMAVTVVAPRLAAAPAGCRLMPLDAALPDTDVLSLHCPLTQATRGMIGAAELAALPPGALVVNTARGGLIDEAALVRALTLGRLGGAALDVTAVEPLPAGDPLRAAPNLILTPHAAALTDGAFRRMGVEAARNVLDFRAGRLRPGVVVVP
ncbi:MAG: NAD(P)-dependent oxidoreductase [Gemmobacter sp.]